MRAFKIDLFLVTQFIHLPCLHSNIFPSFKLRAILLPRIAKPKKFKNIKKIIFWWKLLRSAFECAVPGASFSFCCLFNTVDKNC